MDLPHAIIMLLFMAAIATAYEAAGRMIPLTREYRKSSMFKNRTRLWQVLLRRTRQTARSKLQPAMVRTGALSLVPGVIHRRRRMKSIIIDYTNYKGERRSRHVLPMGDMEFMANEFHQEPQWLMRALDMERNDGIERTFAMKEIHSWRPATQEDINGTYSKDH